MKHCAIQQSNFAACEDMMRSYSDKKDAVVCPMPRRIIPVRSLRWHVSHQQDLCDSRVGTDLLDIILTKVFMVYKSHLRGSDMDCVHFTLPRPHLVGIHGGGGSVDQSAAQVASSPPFFCGSPPSRVSNPLIQDAQFGDEKVTPVSPRAIPIPSGLASSPSTSARKSGCVSRANFGHNPAVRVDGFDCLDRDRRNCSIPALA